MTEGPKLRAWATRTSGAIGFFLAIFYLAIIVGEEEGLTVGPLAWFGAMMLGAFLAWFADRASYTTGRKMAMVAAAVSLVIGSLAVLTIGIAFLAAAVLSVVGIVGTAQPKETD
jgi:hypothetical protein